MRSYYKLVATNENKIEWMIEEFKNGRLRFGWSPKEANLNILSDKDTLKDEEKIWWARGKFILNRLKEDDIVIVQLKRHLREFLIGRVVKINNEIYNFDGGQNDFNHIINIEPITNEPINSNSKLIPSYFVHDITKRGHYYEIYPEISKNFVEELIEKRYWENVDFKIEASTDNSINSSVLALKKFTLNQIREEWKSKDFEILVTKVFNAMENITAVNRDSSKGWDIIITVKDPILGEEIDIPVQCKNYNGVVNITGTRAIDDLERCIKNHDGKIAYLVILGKLSDEFIVEVENRATRVGGVFKIIDENMFIDLYLSVINKI